MNFANWSAGAASILCSVAVLLGSASALAQQPTPAPPPDVIRTKDGGLLRGTIVESIPGEKVVILLPTGELREVPMDQVDHAGPLGDAPPAWTPPPTPPTAPDPSAAPSAFPPAPSPPAPASPDVTLGAPASLVLTADEPGITYFLYHGSTSRPIGGNVILTLHSFDRLCTAPCRMNLKPGNYRLALALPDRDPTPARRSIDITPSTRGLHGSYTSLRGVRIGGWMLLVGGAAMGMGGALLIVSDPSTSYVLMGVGGGVMLIGLIMALLKDRARIVEVEP
jgi:hypothetical protein